MSRFVALKEEKSRRDGKANSLGAQAPLPACFSQSAVAGTSAGKDACAPREFALTPSMRSFVKVGVNLELFTRPGQLKCLDEFVVVQDSITLSCAPAGGNVLDTSPRVPA